MKHISLVQKDVADFVDQNPTSLCRYFKKSTDKSIFQVLAEIRIEQRRLAPWTHNKTIQKAIESYRITPEQKEYLRTLKIK